MRYRNRPFGGATELNTPNIYHYPGEEDAATYDLENAIADPEQRLERSMEGIAPLAGTWAGRRAMGSAG